MVGSVFAIPRTDSKRVTQVVRSSGGKIASRDRVAMPLSRFYAGPENALTRLAATSVTDQWVRFNPLFVSGPAGVGKTHLLHSLIAASQVEYSALNSLWITGADYARAIANGIDVDSLDELRQAHRSVDLLVLDGLHEFASKMYAQQELVHTIDSLVERNGQVIISSRIGLGELHALLPALASRLSSGLQIPMVPPASATRRVILDELAKLNDVDIPRKVSQRLTTEPNRPRSKPLMVHDLTAAIAELGCFGEQADDRRADAVDRIVSHANAVREVTAKDINKQTAKYFNVTVRELTGNSRKKTVVRARAAAVYLIRTNIECSFQIIGQGLGGRDHTTVMHAFQRAKEWLAVDAGFSRAIMEIELALD